MIRVALFCLLLFVNITSIAPAQTPPPARMSAIVQKQLINGCLLDLPEGWIEAPNGSIVMQAFRTHVGARMQAIYHPSGARPTDLPYAILEEVPAPKNPTQTEQEDAADAIAEYFRTSLNPPSKADRAALWKRAIVSPIHHDFVNRRFNFHATIHFDVGGDYEIEVAGVFGTDAAMTLSTWYDANALATQGDAIKTLSGSLRLGGPPPGVPLQQQLLSIAKIAGAILILALVGLQLYVVWRERRERAAEAIEFD